jgi:hypothetical protein
VRPLWLVRIVPRPETFRVDRPGETCELVGVDVDAAGVEVVVGELLLPHAAANNASGTTSRALDRKASLLEIDARWGDGAYRPGGLRRNCYDAGGA